MLKNLISITKFGLSKIISPKNINVLMYHSIKEGNNRFLEISPEVFGKQMKFLVDKKYNIISASELLNILENKKEIGLKTIALTFDDGYKDNYTNVFPLIKKYNLPIVIFLVIDLIGKEGYLNWNEIKEMQNSGLVEFGCHSKTHQNLNEIDESDLQKEIEEGKKIIEENLGKECLFFSYPRGKFNDLIIKEVKKVGFKTAFTVQEGTVFFNDDMLKLNRLSINSLTNWWQFLGKISGIQFVKNKI